MTTTVTFSYLYQTNRDYSSNMLYNILNNITQGAAGKLLNVAVNKVNDYLPSTASIRRMENDLFKF